LNASDADRGQAVVHFQAAELRLDGGSAPVEVAPAVSAARDERVAPVGPEPHRLGLARAGRAAPLGALALEVGPGERPASVLALGRANRGALGVRAERDDGAAVALLAAVVDGVVVVAFVERARSGREAA